ncbi:peptide chain release factor 1 [Kiloniella litopenaei]|uniref:peptide chain release factor 1 n=1 Tax=Kiloniella litopenaei TaxID=1549748 RepID=UPI003BAA87D9
MKFDEKLDAVVARYDELNAVISTHQDPGSNEYTKLLRELSELTSVVETVQELRSLQTEMADLAEMLNDPDADSEMRDLAQEEFLELKQKLPEMEHQVQIMLLPKDVDGERNAILEVRAGTGGDEAGLFAAELFRMYQRYAETSGWRFEALDYSENGIGGVKEATALITGAGVFSNLKFESGVHRVQRVPVTESGGRIHTSAATVAVMPEAQEVDVEINPADLRIDTYRAQGAGGQHVNTTDSAVRITHVPTGVVVQCQDGRSQHKNKEQAMKMLLTQIYDNQRQEQEKEQAANRKSQVGSGDRSERIRTYNFPQGRVTDHRINLTLYKLDKVITGEALDEVINALIAEDQAERLAEIQ